MRIIFALIGLIALASAQTDIAAPEEAYPANKAEEVKAKAVAAMKKGSADTKEAAKVLEKGVEKVQKSLKSVSHHEAVVKDLEEKLEKARKRLEEARSAQDSAKENLDKNNDGLENAKENDLKAELKKSKKTAQTCADNLVTMTSKYKNALTSIRDLADEHLTKAKATSDEFKKAAKPAETEAPKPVETAAVETEAPKPKAKKPVKKPAKTPITQENAENGNPESKLALKDNVDWLHSEEESVANGSQTSSYKTWFYIICVFEFLTLFAAGKFYMEGKGDRFSQVTLLEEI